MKRLVFVLAVSIAASLSIPATADTTITVRVGGNEIQIAPNSEQSVPSAENDPRST